MTIPPQTLRQLQADDDKDPNWKRAHISQIAAIEAIIDLHRLLLLLGVATVEEAEAEIKELQSYKRTFKVLIGVGKD